VQRPSLLRHVRHLALTAALATAGCEDGPTAPSVFTHPADGEVWAAILVPEGTPDARTWLPYVREGRGSTNGALGEVRRLQGEADRLRRSGDLVAALALDEDAAMTAAGAVTQAPPANVLITAIGALDTWVERAHLARAQGSFEDLEERLVEVKRERSLAREALELGDTAAAIQRVTAGATLIREQAPASVAARALIRAERRIEALVETDTDAARAVRLLRYSREALANGDPVRALRRALYALQLAEQISAPVAASGGGRA
jgi:hypothetical protein